jgi:hypothetical protein
LLYNSLRRLRKRWRKHDCENQATRATNNTRITLSQVTNDLLSKLWNFERLEALNVTLNELLALVLNENEWSAWVK